MNEHDEALIQAYAAGELDADAMQRVEAMVAQSPEAAALLVQYEALMADFSFVADEPLTVDLTPAVMAQLPAQTAVPGRWFRWVVGGQLVVLLALLLWMWPRVVGYWQEGVSALQQWETTVSLPSLLVWQEMFTTITAVFSQSIQNLPQFALPSSQWLLLLAGTLVVWLIGNRLLITNEHGGSHG